MEIKIKLPGGGEIHVRREKKDRDWFPLWVTFGAAMFLGSLLLMLYILRQRGRGMKILFCVSGTALLLYLAAADSLLDKLGIVGFLLCGLGLLGTMWASSRG